MQSASKQFGRCRRKGVAEKSNWTGRAVVGGSANGRRAWKDARGRTLKVLQEERAREAQ